MKATNGGVSVEKAETCFFCGQVGQPLYRSLRDRLQKAPGSWQFSQCCKCKLIWLTSRPTVEDICKVYSSYFTHQPDIPTPGRISWIFEFQDKLQRRYATLTTGEKLSQRWQVRALTLVPLLNDTLSSNLMYLERERKGRLLDVGCGNGKFLALMQSLGWDVLGVEPDGQAARVAAEEYGIPVTVGTVEQADLTAESFDVVTLNHVLEHVHNPMRLLQECRRVLKPKGKISMLTPNTESLGHKIFNESWRGLEPPRHLHLFAMQTLKRLLEGSGFHVEKLKTTTRLAPNMWSVSRVIRQKGRYTRSDLNWRLVIEGILFQLVEEAVRIFRRNAGEELMLIAVKD